MFGFFPMEDGSTGYSSDSTNRLNTGAIIGIAIAATLLVGGCIATCWCLYRRSRATASVAAQPHHERVFTRVESFQVEKSTNVAPHPEPVPEHISQIVNSDGRVLERQLTFSNGRTRTLPTTPSLALTEEIPDVAIIKGPDGRERGKHLIYKSTRSLHALEDLGKTATDVMADNELETITLAH